MRISAFAMLALLCGAIPMPAQSPDHAETRPAWKAFYSQHDAFRKQGAETFRAEMAREATGDCGNASNMADINMCLSREVAATQQNYRDYVAAIGGLLRLHAPGVNIVSTREKPGAGAELDAAESTWLIYRQAECKAAQDQYARGTVMPSAFMTCQLQLTRRHMRELQSVYSNLWR